MQVIEKRQPKACAGFERAERQEGQSGAHSVPVGCHDLTQRLHKSTIKSEGSGTGNYGQSKLSCPPPFQWVQYNCKTAIVNRLVGIILELRFLAEAMAGIYGTAGVPPMREGWVESGLEVGKLTSRFPHSAPRQRLLRPVGWSPGIDFRSELASNSTR